MDFAGTATVESLAPCPSLEDALLDCLGQIFARLEQSGIPFCVLRNRDRIPSGLISGSDVDLIVPTRVTCGQLVRLLADMKPVQVVPHRSTVEVYFAVGPMFLHVDFLINDREWRGARYLENREILEQVREDRGIPVASPLHQAFCAWFSSLTRKGVFKPRYVPLITEATREQPAEMRQLLQHTFGNRLADDLLRLVDEDKIPETEQLTRRCRRSIWMRALARNPLRPWWGIFRHYLPELRLFIRPTGLTVAILGPDGAGKSAVCTALADGSRADLPFSRTETQHLYRRVLPLLSELKKGRLRRAPATPAVTHDPHGKRPHHPLFSLITLSYYTLDQWLSRLVHARPRLWQNALLLHDRHMMEVVIDPKRFRHRIPRWMARLFARLAPQPDLVILLDAPTEVLQSRKQEVPFEETFRQRQAYLEMISGLPAGRVVDATQSPDRVVAEVRRTIGQFLARRTKRRFRLEASGERVV